MHLEENELFFFSRTSELIVVQDTKQSGVDIYIHTKVIFFLFFLHSFLCFLSPLWRIKHNEKNFKSSACIILSLFQIIPDSAES